MDFITHIKIHCGTECHWHFKCVILQEKNISQAASLQVFPQIPEMQ